MTPRRKAKVIVNDPIIAERLLAVKNGDSLRQFAKRCDVNYRRLGVWLTGANSPDAGNLRRIALATGRSADWLLGVPGAREYRVNNEDPTPDSEIAARIASAVAEHLSGEGVRPHDVRISLPELLDWIGEAIARELRPKLAAEASAVQTSLDALAIDAFIRHLSEWYEREAVPEEKRSQYRSAVREIDNRLARLVGMGTQYGYPGFPGLLIHKVQQSGADNEAEVVRQLATKTPSKRSTTSKRRKA